MLLIDYCRDVLGLKMGAVYRGSHFGYTTDWSKVAPAREAGAIVMPCGKNGVRDTDVSLRGPHLTVDAWEISFAIGRESLVR